MRESGSLMNIGSLVSDFGLGNIGESSYNFIDFLYHTGQSYWQMLPINQTEVPHNPYKPISSFAMEPNFLDFNLLRKSSYLISEDLSHVSISRFKTSIDYYNLKINNFKMLRRAYLRGQSWDIDEIRDFRQANSYWIKHYAQYMSLKEHFKESNYMHWDLKARYPNQDHLLEYGKILNVETYFWYFSQYRFYRQWRNLKKYAEKKSIKLIGELPSRVINASVDMWAYSDFFIKKAEGNNDYTSHNWKTQKEDGYSWWQERFRQAKEYYHIVKLTIDEDVDQYLKMLKEIDLGNLEIILEINDIIDEETKKVIKENGYYLSKIIDTKKNDKSSSKNHKGIKRIIYTSSTKKPLNTIFHKTGIFEKISKARSFNKGIFSSVNWIIVESALERDEDIAIIAFRDIINRSKKVIIEDVGGRTNNWSWRLGVSSIDSGLEGKIKGMLKKSKRYNKKNS